jgi:Uma2 family endonuclease
LIAGAVTAAAAMRSNHPRKITAQENAMSRASSPFKMSLAEYMQWEPLQTEKHEYWDGHVYSQAGGSRKHSLVGTNLLGEVRARLKGHPCEAHGSDLRIDIRATGYQAYPDLSVVCPPVEGDSVHVISNPVLIAEVLSPSTEDFDRGTKFGHYRTIASLQEYLVLWQDIAKLELHAKTPEGYWLLREISGIDQSVSLASLGGAKIALADIYDKIELSN